MKKILLSILCILLITGCTKKVEEPVKKEIDKPTIIEEPIVEEPKYVDDNPIKLSFYLDEGANWHKQNEYYSPMTAYQDIEWFNIFLSQDDYIPITSIKNDWSIAASKYENVNNYRIGYELSFKTKDGKEIIETITKPLNLFDYKFAEYVYIWVYDDVNATSDWYSHLEPEQYNEQTWMSSIKLMATEATQDIDGPINLKVFTFKDENDFDPDTNQYRGNSWTTLKIYKN